MSADRGSRRPSVGYLYDEERVTIFVSEHDLQRLMAKQEIDPKRSDSRR